MSDRRILALDGSLAGDGGNSAALLGRAAELLRPHASVTRACLARDPGFAAHAPALAAADALVLATGTYWDSWSSHLQRFLEEATASEGSALWLGKPAAVLVTAHSVGAKGVLSRLQGVLVTLGVRIPPMGGLVVTEVGQLARAVGGPATDDIWSAEDLAVVCHNLLVCLRGGDDWRAWPVDRRDPARRWLAP
jgi:NAD(P)H-dependent FMN reductase